MKIIILLDCIENNTITIPNSLNDTEVTEFIINNVISQSDIHVRINNINILSILVLILNKFFDSYKNTCYIYWT